MAGDEKVIPLIFRKEDFEEIYNLKEYRNIILHSDIRNHLLTVVLFAAALLVSIFYSIYKNESIVLLVLLFIGLTGTSINLYFAMRPYMRWKKSVIRFIHSMKAYKRHTLILTESCMELLQDESRTLEKWSSISSFKIETAYIMLTGSSIFMFPKASMTEECFEDLAIFVTGKIK